MLLVDDLAAGGTKNLRHTPRGLVTLYLGLSSTVLYSVMNNLYSEPLSLCYDLAMTKVF